MYIKFFSLFIFTTLALVPVEGIKCYHCFYCEDEAMAAELAPVLGVGDSRADCETHPGEDTLVESALKSTNPLSLSKMIFPNSDPSKFNVKVSSDHCMKAAGTINGKVIVLRRATYFGNDQNGTCVDSEDNTGGLEIIERDCYCNGDACNGANF